ncbi:MAG: hypothetical protein EB012_09435, partial [Gammaproteobacteria bacterium]|nr:hypothetical protein [Gammaproteobacteria bacterium]
GAAPSGGGVKAPLLKQEEISLDCPDNHRHFRAAEVSDLNADGSPEIYVYVSSAGSGSYGTLVAYSANKKKSLSEIYLPPLEETPKAMKGYMGHDEFAVIESSLARRFPLYKDADTNSAPSGGMRQIQYKLKAGEAGWILKIHRIDQF